MLQSNAYFSAPCYLMFPLPRSPDPLTLFPYFSFSITAHIKQYTPVLPLHNGLCQLGLVHERTLTWITLPRSALITVSVQHLQSHTAAATYFQPV